MMPSMRTLNVIGAGRVARTLASLWQAAGTFAIQDVLARTTGSAEAAVTLIGAGHASAALDTMHAADVWMIATPDREIGGTSNRLASSGLLRDADVVFHCSGALASLELGAAAAAGARVASVHPLKSFAD